MNISTSIRILLLTATVFMIHETDMEADAQDANYDETKIPAYELPDSLRLHDGTKVNSAEQWPNRRLEILQLFKDHVYGVMPDPPEKNQSPAFDAIKEIELNLKIDPSDEGSATTRAILKEVKLIVGVDPATNKKHILNLLMFLPINADDGIPATTPMFLGYNFQGNHTVHSTPHITLPDHVWNRGEREPADEAKRGAKSGRWPVGLIVSRGYGVATAYYSDIDPDFDDGFKNGVHSLFPELQNRPDNLTSIGAWAWGLSRVMDYFEMAPEIDQTRVAVFGHSRLGKTSLWAGATDQRFRIVISNNSGCGGAAIARRRIGETVGRINTVFPHWFCKQHKTYNDNENELPVDQHMLIGLIAPRAVYIASAEGDRWADPKGEYLSAYLATPVYELLGQQGIPGEDRPMPRVGRPVGERIGFHIREGKHDIKRYDWQQYLNFAQRHF